MKRGDYRRDFCGASVLHPAEQAETLRAVFPLDLLGVAQHDVVDPPQLRHRCCVLIHPQVVEHPRLRTGHQQGGGLLPPLVPARALPRFQGQEEAFGEVPAEDRGGVRPGGDA